VFLGVDGEIILCVLDDGLGVLFEECERIFVVGLLLKMVMLDYYG